MIITILPSDIAFWIFAGIPFAIGVNGVIIWAVISLWKSLKEDEE